MCKDVRPKIDKVCVRLPHSPAAFLSRSGWRLLIRRRTHGPKTSYPMSWPEIHPPPPSQPSTKRTFVLCRLLPRRWVEITFRFALPDKYIIIRLMTWFAHFLSIYLLLIYISLSPTRFSYIGCFIHRLAEHCRKCVASPTLQQKKKNKNPHTQRCFLSASTPLLQLLPNRR